MVVNMKSLRAQIPISVEYILYLNPATGQAYETRQPRTVYVTFPDEDNYNAFGIALQLYNSAKEYCNKESTKYMNIGNRGGAKELTAIFSAMQDIIGESYGGLEYEFMRTHKDFIEEKVKTAQYIREEYGDKTDLLLWECVMDEITGLCKILEPIHEFMENWVYENMEIEEVPELPKYFMK